MNQTSLEHEVKMLRSLAVSLVGRDREGTYHPAFVRKILRSATQRPTKRFVGKKAFLAELGKNA